jgi:hypothetical protein
MPEVRTGYGGAGACQDTITSPFSGELVSWKP